MSLPTLDEIVLAQRAETEQRQRTGPPAAVLRQLAERQQRRPFRAALEARPFSIIAEIKRASPSAGALRPDLDPLELAGEYAAHGASALSILTCGPWFQGSLEDLRRARQAVELPALCKDFLVTPHQILEAAAAGADAILLIAAALDDGELAELAALARGFGMEILFEAHDAEELSRLAPLRPELVGVNSRNLKTMQIVPDGALHLGPSIPASSHAVYESGVKTSQDLVRARAAGYRTALIGESLLRAEQPGTLLRTLLQGLDA